jgi:hypothetical protein
MTHTIGHFEGPTGNTPGVPCVAGSRLSITNTIGRFEGPTGNTPGVPRVAGSRLSITNTIGRFEEPTGRTPRECPALRVSARAVGR